MSNVVNYGTMGERKNDATYITDVPYNINICNFGNSHGYYGFNYEDIDDDYVCFNFSLPLQSMTYNYRIMENYRNNIAPEAIVYICISLSTFYGTPETSSSSFGSINRRYYQFLDPSYIKNYDTNYLLFVKYFPALIATPKEVIKGVIGKLNSEDYWCESTCSDEAKEHGSKRYESHVKNSVDSDGSRVYNQEEIKAVIDLVNLVYELGGTPILITMPYLSEYTNAVKENDPDFYDDFYDQIKKIQEETGVSYYDYQFDERFINRYDWFFNTDHMNKKGALEFTNVLIKETLPQN